MCSSNLNIVQAKSNYATKDSDTRKISPTIKMVDKTTNTRTEAVIIGDGVSAVIAAISYVWDGIKEQPKRAWKCLLDSGSNDDIIFIKERALRDILNSKRYVSLGWKTSNNTLKQRKWVHWICDFQRIQNL